MVNDISPGVGPEVLCFPPAAKQMLRRWWPSFSLESLWEAGGRVLRARTARGPLQRAGHPCPILASARAPEPQEHLPTAALLAYLGQVDGATSPQSPTLSMFTIVTDLSLQNTLHLAKHHTSTKPAHSRFVSAAPAPLTLGRRWRLRAEAPAEPGALPSPRLGWIRRPEWTLCKGQGKRHPYVSQLQSQTSSSTNFVTFPFLLLKIIKCLGDSCSNCLHYLK